jgi:predicted ATPase/DNA-binding SARP family transcriptional activator
MHVHISLLGDFRFVRGDAPVESALSPRAQSLLAYLIVHRNAPQPRSQIAYTFWPDASESHAHLNLRKQLHALRRALPDAAVLLRVDGSTVQWTSDGPYTLDLADFEQMVAEAGHARSTGDAVTEREALVEAVNRYRGDLLPSCYDEWVLPERERLRQVFTSALERLVELLAQAHDPGMAIAYAQRLLRHDPLREESYRILMRLYAASGDFAGAIRTYRRCEATLRRELDVEPSPETRAIYESVSQAIPAPSLTDKPNNLPAQASTFIGRERELSEVSGLLRRPEVRLVTLTGPAGTGKTRLALQVASDLVNRFEHGAFWVPLAPVSDPDLVPSAIAQALGVRESAGKGVLDSLKSYLQDKQILLLLDNFEHVIQAALYVSDLLATCPGVKVLVTSRAPLHLRGEKEFPVPTLALPDLSRAYTLEELAEHEALALFVERALDCKPDFALTKKNANDLVALCLRLEGLPLAIELAAARVKVLSPQAMVARLEEQGGKLRLLVGGPRDLPPRQRALRDAIAWSYDLLNADEQRALRLLGVFAGGCTLEGAEAVIGGQDSRPALDLVSSLLDKSLLASDESDDGQTRYRMLETIREYALEQLAAHGEVEDARSLHSEYYLRMAETSERELRGARQGEWLARVEVEHDNLRAVLSWAIGKGDAALAVSLSGALWTFWFMHGHLSEGRRWLRTALALPGPVPEEARASALNALAAAALQQGEYAEAELLLAESLPIWRSLGDQRGMGRTLNQLASVAFFARDFASAFQLYEESLGYWRTLGEQWQAGTVLSNLGLTALNMEDYSRAERLLVESVEMQRALSDRGVAIVGLGNLGSVYLHRGDYDRAASLYKEFLERNRAIGDKRNEVHALRDLGRVAACQGEYETALNYYQEGLKLAQELGDRPCIVRFLACWTVISVEKADWYRVAWLGGIVSVQREMGGINMTPDEVEEHRRSVEEARTMMGEAEWTATWERGRAVSLERAVEQTLAEG